EDGIRAGHVTGIQTCALPISQLHVQHRRLDNLQAAVLDVKLRHLSEWNDERRARAAHYVRLLDAAGLIARTATQRRAGLLVVPRSEERRVGKEGRCRCADDVW